jgi:hypothetical protein
MVKYEEWVVKNQKEESERKGKERKGLKLFENLMKIKKNKTNRGTQQLWESITVRIVRKQQKMNNKHFPLRPTNKMNT